MLSVMCAILGVQLYCTPIVYIHTTGMAQLKKLFTLNNNLNGSITMCLNFKKIIPAPKDV